MHPQSTRALARVVLLLLASCAIEDAKDVGFTDRAVQKDMREMLKAQKKCPKGQHPEELKFCEGDPACESMCVDDK